MEKESELRLVGIERKDRCFELPCQCSLRPLGPAFKIPDHCVRHTFRQRPVPQNSSELHLHPASLSGSRMLFDAYNDVGTKLGDRIKQFVGGHAG